MGHRYGTPPGDYLAKLRWENLDAGIWFSDLTKVYGFLQRRGFIALTSLSKVHPNENSQIDNVIFV